MSDRLLKDLAKLDRDEEGALDPRLDRLAAGTLDDKERAELEALAATDPAVREAIEAFTPLDEAAKDRIAEKAGAAYAARPAAVIDLAARRKKIVGGLLVLAAAAVFLMLFLRPSAPPLPGYALELSAGDRVLRSGEAPAPEVPKFSSDSRIEIVLRPATETAADVEARAFYADTAGLHPLTAGFEAAPGGALRFAGAAKDLLPDARGELELAFIVGRRASLPNDAEAWRSLKGEDWTLLIQKIELR